MNLYQIDSAILDCVDMETGEVIDSEKLTALQMERDEKIQNIALWVKNLEADAKAYKEEKDSFAAKQKAAENKADSLKKYLTTYLEGQSFKSTRVNVSFRASESVNVTDISKLPEQFLKQAEPTADKAAIKKMLKDGFAIDGAELVTNQNIQIK